MCRAPRQPTGPPIHRTQAPASAHPISPAKQRPPHAHVLGRDPMSSPQSWQHTSFHSRCAAHGAGSVRLGSWEMRRGHSLSPAETGVALPWPPAATSTGLVPTSPARSLWFLQPHISTLLQVWWSSWPRYGGRKGSEMGVQPRLPGETLRPAEAFRTTVTLTPTGGGFGDASASEMEDGEVAV